MHIYQIPRGPIESNCYLLETETAAVLIDPSVPYSELPPLNKPVKAIIVTHCHYDHIAYIEEIKNAFHAPVYCHPLEFPAFGDAVKNASALFMADHKYPRPDYELKDNQILEIDGGVSLRVLHTPGHTPGSICLAVSVNGRETALLTGDTLFQGSVGRTDLGGDPQMLKESLRRLKQFADDVAVYSGHGDATTIGEEKRSNPFLRSELYSS